MAEDHKRIVLVVLGQVVSLCLVGTSACSALLAKRGLEAPMLQSFLNYALLLAVYGGTVASNYCTEQAAAPGGGSEEPRGLLSSLRGVGWRSVAAFLLFAVADIEGNFLIVWAYQLTSLTSVTLLDCFSIPVVTILSCAFLGTRYTAFHLAGVVLALCGLVLLVVTDLSSSGGDEPSTQGNRGLGDGLTLAAATLYGISNTLQEGCLAHIEDWRKVLAGLGLAATLISGVQCFVLEREAIVAYAWVSWDFALLGAYVACLFGLYSMVPHLLISSGATFLNLSLLTSDFWAILFGVTVLHERLQWTYFVAFATTIGGIIVYHMKGVPGKTEGLASGSAIRLSDTKDSERDSDHDRDGLIANADSV